MKRAVLNDNGNFVIASPCRISKPGRRAGQHAGQKIRSPTANQVKSRRACIHIHPRHAERVIVIPESRRALIVQVLSDGSSGLPWLAPFRLELLPKRFVEGADSEV